MFYPIGYGADPSGVKDSSDAFLKAIGDAFQLQNGAELVEGVNDLGGVVIDLQGGNYKITQPLRFPSGGGNVLVSLFYLCFSVPLALSVCLCAIAFNLHRILTSKTVFGCRRKISSESSSQNREETTYNWTVALSQAFT